MTEQVTYCLAPDEALPWVLPEGTKAIYPHNQAEFIFANGHWQPYGPANPFMVRENPDGTSTVVMENLEVTGSFTAEEFYFQSMNGVNGALFVAPSGRVKNFSRPIDHLPPSGILHDVDYITDTSALFSGIVEPQGEEGVAYHFEYGPSLPASYQASGDISYGLSTPKTKIDGRIPITVTETVISLAMKQQYDVRLVIESKSGVYITNPVKFTTHYRSTPEISAGREIFISTADVTAAYKYGATLHGSITANGNPLVFFFKIWTAGGGYQLKTDMNTVPMQVVATVTYDLTNLKSGTAYYCSLCAIDTDGKTHEGPAVQFSTIAETYERPVPMAGKTNVSNIQSEQADLQGLVSPFAQPISYRFEYWRSPEKVLQTAAVQTQAGAPFVTSATITGLHPSRDYFVQLAIYYTNADGDAVKITGGTTIFTTPE